ncbi:MAG: ABC transporter substrate-binding protein [Burkholderiales bacterium]
MRPSIMQRLGISSLLASSIFMVSATAQAQQTVKIGVLTPLTGSSASDGAWLMKGHDLAIEEINARGGIRSLNGAKVQLVVGDTQSKPETGRGEAERLIEREKVSGLVGGWTSAISTVIGQVAERSEVPYVISNAVADFLTEKNQKYVFRVSPKSKWAVEEVGKFLDVMAARGMPVSKAAIIYDDGPYGQSVATNYRALLAAKKISVVADESFRAGVSDLSTAVSKMRAGGADVVFMAGLVNESIVLFRAMSAQSFRPMFVGYGQGHVQPALLQSGKAVEGTFGIVEWMPDMNKDSVRKFVTAFEAKYKETPLATSAQAYVATWAVIDAVEKARSADPKAVRDALASLKTKTGPVSLLPSDEFAFDASGQLPVGSVVAQVINGKFVTVWPDSVAAQKMIPLK